MLLVEVVAVWMGLAKGIIYISSLFLRIAFSRPPFTPLVQRVAFIQGVAIWKKEMVAVINFFYPTFGQPQ